MCNYAEKIIGGGIGRVVLDVCVEVVETVHPLRVVAGFPDSHLTVQHVIVVDQEPLGRGGNTFRTDNSFNNRKEMINLRLKIY